MFHQTLLDQPMLTSLDSVNQMTLNISKWNMIDLSNQCWKSIIKSDCTVLYLYMKLKIKSRNFISRFEMLMAEIMFTYTCTCICLHSTDPVYTYLLSNPVWTWCPLGGGWGRPSATDISPEMTDSQPSGCWTNPTLCHVPSHKTG